ncbi:MHYT domain-containing protein [Ancylobacter pratisalsi]|nr:MHYT domain-containing protein [Ancylobacter pratisalsi]
MGSHEPVLVAVSILIAVAASYTALDLAGRIPRARSVAKVGWLATAAIVLGGGIWAMHFVAMLALHLDAPVSYDIGLTILSFTIAVVVTGAALALSSRSKVSRRSVLAAGCFMGLGIVAMHYTGMAAMRLNGEVTNDWRFVAIATLVAIAASTAAVWLAFRHHSLRQRVAGSLALGIGISGMHYVAMFGTTLPVSSHEMIPDIDPGIDNIDIVIAVTAATFVILAAALMAAVHDRRSSRLMEREALLWREGEERYRTLYRRTPLPLHSLNAEGRIEQVSDSWLDLLGYGREEVVGRPLTDFMTVDSARRRTDEHWPQLLDTGELREAEYKLIARDGRVLDCILSAVAERDSEGRLTKTLCGLINVTERRQAEEALRQAQKLEAIGRLTGGIAHDFNNLLAVIVGNLELARKRAPDEPRLIALLDNTMQAAQRGAALTQRMLAFARRQDLNPEPVDVPELVLGMADLMRRSIGPSIQIETRFPLGLPRARVDSNQLELALLNLAVNARDAMPDGGTITIAAREEVIVADGEPDSEELPPNHYFCLSVTDTGTGMDDDTLNRAAEPFFTTKGVGKGTGLGLAMVHGLAAQSGGRLVLSSRPGKGTTASIYLPLAEAAAKKSVGSDAYSASAKVMEGGQARVLVVDDDPLVLSATSAMLEDLNYRVTEASSGKAALAVLDTGADFDVVLTDQAMPGMTGVQLAAAIRERRPNLPIILGTGYAELPQDANAGVLRLGKPFGREALHRAIDTATHRPPDNVVNLPSRIG